MGTQLGAQRRARLLLGCRDVQEQVPGAAAKSLGRGQQGKATSGFNTPRAQAWLPAPGFGPALIPHVLQVLAAGFGDTSDTKPGKGPCNANICFLPPISPLFPFISFQKHLLCCKSCLL